MATTSPRARPRRSAFAAAFLSFVLPGLGHAYLRRWTRAAAWAVLPMLAIAAGAGILVGPNRTEILTSLVDPDLLLATLGLIVLDLLYRLAAVVDAWRLARQPGLGTRMTRLLSTAGVVAVTIVLVVSHVALARPVMLAYDTLSTFDGEGGDTSPIPTIEDLGPEWADLIGAVDPEALGGAEAAELEIPERFEWDGNERLNILLIGIDSGRRGSRTFLTDTMIVVSVDPGTGRLALISLPRDTSDIPLPPEWDAARRIYGDRYGGKINTLYTAARARTGVFPGNDKQRGYRALRGALGELYGIDIPYHVSVDLRGFRGAVNALGGIVVDVRAPLREDVYPTDDGRGKIRLYVRDGIVRMNGREALAYARSRKSTSDFARSARQQELIAAVRSQLDIAAILQPGVLDALTKQFRRHVTTNIPARTVPRLLALANDVDLKRRKTLVLSNVRGFSTECNGQTSAGVCTADGQYKLIANVPRIRNAVRGIFDRRSGARAEG